MKRTATKGRTRLARAMGLLAVLGLPLAAITPITGNAPSTPVDAAASAPQAEAATDAPSESTAAAADLDEYTPASPRDAAPNAPSALVDVESSESSPAGATPVTSIVNDSRCGEGFTSIQVTGKGGFTCVHSVHDPLPPASTPAARASAASAAPVCLGNGVNGPRLQLIYMYVEGQPNRAGVMVPKIANEFVPRMEGVFRETSKLQGREVGMRLHMPDCQLSVETLMIDADNGAPDDPGSMLGRITETVSQAGHSGSDRKYVVWFDGGNSGACGIAPAFLGPVVGDNPTALNINNLGWQGVRPETAVIFRYGAPILGPAPSHVGECWGRGGTGARTEIHELIHLLGAVSLSAPNSNGFGHCTDDHDIMCYGEQGVSTIPRCATVVEQLDCGADDYFNARPSAGSYLSTHWNTANSKFLGEAIVHDAVPAEIPRP